VHSVMNVQHGGFKFFVIFIVPWTILSDQKQILNFLDAFWQKKAIFTFAMPKTKKSKKSLKNFFFWFFYSIFKMLVKPRKYFFTMKNTCKVECKSEKS
jgi:hypothetical protein